MYYVYMKLDLNKFKKLFVNESINDGKYELLSSKKSIKDVYKISGFGSLDVEGYEHGFLFLKKGSSILEHLHNDDIEIYRYISGDRISDSICLLGNSHKTDRVDNDTIIEYFKMNKNVINKDLDINKLNYYLQIQALHYLWRIDELLVKFAYHPNDLFYSNFDQLSYYYQISVESIKKMYELYFYKSDNLPYLEEPINLGDITFDNYDIPYVVEKVWQYELVKHNTNDNNDIRNKQNKSLIKTKNNYSD